MQSMSVIKRGGWIELPSLFVHFFFSLYYVTIFNYMYYYIYVTIFLCAEYECHKESKVAGLNCLRNQLTGDELLVWTIETFNMFYKKVSTYLL